MGGVVKQGCFSFELKQSVLQPQQDDSQNSAVFSGDDSFVDQFLNLQNADNQQDADHLFDQSENLQTNEKTPGFQSSPFLEPATVAGAEDLCSVLALPEEDSELEWLSQFMEEDSFSQPCPTVAGIPTPPEKPSPGNEAQKSLWNISLQTTLPRSRRSKRRPATFTGLSAVWPISSSSATDSTTSSSSSSSATSSPWPPTSPSTPLVFQTPVPNPKKKNRVIGPGSSMTGLARRCSHCGTQKTPQWRAGPQGLKTLCNACGVRFKSGRLFPEYRPASSPTFSSEVHSNSHRKVLEMRMKKDVMVQPKPGFNSGLTSFG